jgi:hypothetical protein
MGRAGKAAQLYPIFMIISINFVEMQLGDLMSSETFLGI